MNDLITDALGVLVDLLRERPWLRGLLTAVSGSVLAGALIVTFAAHLLLREEVAWAASRAGPVVALIAGLLFGAGLLSFTSVKIRGSGRLFTAQLETLRKERQQLQKRLSETSKPDILDTIQLNLNQLNEYYTINKSQARGSFRFSVFAVVAGLVTILGGVWLFLLRQEPRYDLAMISSVAGLLTEFIGGAYFYLYRKSLEQLNFFFDQLVRMQDTMLSVRLCDDIQNPDKRLELRETIIMKLLERSSGALSAEKQAA